MAAAAAAAGWVRGQDRQQQVRRSKGPNEERGHAFETQRAGGAWALDQSRGLITCSCPVLPGTGYGVTVAAGGGGSLCPGHNHSGGSVGCRMVARAAAAVGAGPGKAWRGGGVGWGRGCTRADMAGGQGWGLELDMAGMAGLVRSAPAAPETLNSAVATPWQAVACSSCSTQKRGGNAPCCGGGGVGGGSVRSKQHHESQVHRQGAERWRWRRHGRLYNDDVFVT